MKTFFQSPYNTFFIFNNCSSFVGKSLKQSLCASSKLSTSIPKDVDIDLVLRESRLAVEKRYPELCDLVDEGKLAVVERRLFGPVPPWRSEFSEPDEIWLLGTNHVSLQSVEDVRRLIRTVQPDNVVVELCRGRAGIMYTLELDTSQKDGLRTSGLSLTSSGFFEAIWRSINLGGQSALALRVLLALFASKISSNVDRPFGSEFRAAREAAEEIGAQIVLGDRPIEITLKRAWEVLTWRERLSLVSTILSNTSSIKDFEASDSKDGQFQLYERISEVFPSLVKPLICERDIYLAWSLKRSKAVNNSKRVVGVIGGGHLTGVIQTLVSDQGNLRFRDLVGSKTQGGVDDVIGQLVGSLARDIIIGVLLWELYNKFMVHT